MQESFLKVCVFSFTQCAMVRSALLRYAAGGFHLSRNKRETIQSAVKQGLLFSDIEDALNLSEERKRSSIVEPINFEPEKVLYEEENQKTPEPPVIPVKKIRIVEEIPEYNIQIRLKNLIKLF